jgi:hypothetical protein
MKGGDRVEGALAYRAPALVWRRETAQTEPVLWWAIVVGFAYTLALAWASYCIYKGGRPVISFGWSGFKVACYR